MAIGGLEWRNQRRAVSERLLKLCHVAIEFFDGGRRQLFVAKAGPVEKLDQPRRQLGEAVGTLNDLPDARAHRGGELALGLRTWPDQSKLAAQCLEAFIKRDADLPIGSPRLPQAARALPDALAQPDQHDDAGHPR